MSYEQKYLKYKQKYQELKKMLGDNSVHKLETETFNDVAEFNLTDTPTTFDLPKLSGGGVDENNNEEIEFNLTDTPTEQTKQVKQRGGAPLVPFDYTPSAPLASCAGQVNPQPNVNVPMTGGANLMPADYTPSAPLPSCAGQVNPQPNVNVPGVVTQNKNLVNNNEEELNTTTDLSEIQNTEDIAKLFNQFGGKHSSKHSESSSSSSGSSSSTDTSDSDISTSDSF
jgi:hypothetical protein